MDVEREGGDLVEVGVEVGVIVRTRGKVEVEATEINEPLLPGIVEREEPAELEAEQSVVTDRG